MRRPGGELGLLGDGTVVFLREQWGGYHKLSEFRVYCWFGESVNKQ